MMPFVQRVNGVIVGCFSAPQEGVPEEFISESDPAIIEYRQSITALDPRRIIDDAECEAAKIDGQIVAFLNMTPAQLDVWVDTNITGAGPRTAFKILGRLAQNAARGKTMR